jgi:acyl carrier protein
MRGCGVVSGLPTTLHQQYIYAGPEVQNTKSMGLDTVEIVLRTEETFNINLPDDECSQVVTVGDLYRLVLGKIELPYTRADEIEAAGQGRNRSHLTMPSLSSWSPPDVWLTLKGIIVDQLKANEEDVTEEATFLRDLGCD